MRVLIDGQTLSTPEINRGIGVVFKRICEELVVNDITKDWLITVRNVSDVTHFSPAAQKRLTPINVSESLNQDDYIKQTKHYSQLLNKVVTEFQVDAYWTPNPLMMNVVLPTDLYNVTVFATIYDLIPLMMPQDYLDKWPEHLRQEYQRRIKSLVTWGDRLIFISESARRDFESIDPRITDKSVVVPLAVDHTKFWSHISLKDQSKAPYILFTGGFDPRKNMIKALEAFSHLINDHPKEFENLKFYVVCACNDEARQSYEQLADKLGVLDKLILTGYVEDDELVALYREASVFFFPSRYEGFGLPVLEALACGLPVVTTKVSSIPEIVGDLAYYCSPDDSKDMAIALRKALGDVVAGNQCRRLESIQRAREFTWAKTAASYFRLFTNTLLDVNNAGKLERYKIAYVSPWSPQRSGIANYSFELIRHLKEYLDITLYLEHQEESSTHDLALEVKDISLLAQDIEKIDCIVYHIGNNTKFHKEIYKMAWQYPGIVVIHDFNIHPFLADAFLNTDDEYLYADALSKGYGGEGTASYELIKSGSIMPEIWKFPMSHALAQRSIATIVHSRWVKDQLQGIDNVFVIPHGSVTKINTPVSDTDKTLKEHLGILDNKFLIATFGFVNQLKRLPEILQAIKILLEQGYPIQFFIGGELIEPSMSLEEKIMLLEISDNVIISGYLEDEDFEGCLKLSDIVLNLRYPSLGECSGVLMKALGYGKACIVSNYRQFAELPNSACWKVDIGDLEVPQLVAYLEELMRNPTARKQLGKNAAFLAENYYSYEIAGKLYAMTISSMMQIKKIKKEKIVNLNLPTSVALKIGQPSFQVVGSTIDKSLVQYIEVHGSYEQHLQISFMKFLAHGHVCIDVGANIGVHSILMSKLVGESGQVYCYEASPDNHIYLKKNLEINNCKNVQTEQVGLWDKHTELEFSYVEEVAGCSFFSTSGVREGKKQIVNCKPLDSLTSKYPETQRISLIKIDCEGAEIYVIKGAIQTIKKHSPTICLEINPTTIKRFFLSDFKELYQIILELDYSVYWIKHDGNLNELKTFDALQNIFKDEGFQWIDVVCLPNFFT